MSYFITRLPDWLFGERLHGLILNEQVTAIFLVVTVLLFVSQILILVFLAPTITRKLDPYFKVHMSNRLSLPDISTSRMARAGLYALEVTFPGLISRNVPTMKGFDFRSLGRPLIVLCWVNAAVTLCWVVYLPTFLALWLLT
ncbi:MAG: hypothetical protein HY537_10360 [Deltaproteobacteria bacterium]|nr:hypothetical protein [Deltaproteobacteria bacterium]